MNARARCGSWFVYSSSVLINRPVSGMLRLQFPLTNAQKHQILAPKTLVMGKGQVGMHMCGSAKVFCRTGTVSYSGHGDWIAHSHLSPTDKLKHR